MAFPVAVHGHRGARAVLPENTIAGFEYAIAQGVDWIELDVWVTKDDRVVVVHDPLMNVHISSGPPGAPRVVREMTLEQLRKWDVGSRTNPAFPRQKPIPGAWAPTLDEVLSLAPDGRCGFNIEVKSEPRRPALAPAAGEYAALVAEAVVRANVVQRTLIQSFDWRIVRKMAALAPELARSALFPATVTEGRRDFVDVAREAGVTTVSVHYLTVTPAKVRRAHDAGIRVITWTANNVRTWRRLVAAGVDEIITDDPVGLIAWLRRAHAPGAPSDMRN